MKQFSIEKFINTFNELKALEIEKIEAGLRQDWWHTAGTIYENGFFIRDTYIYTSSFWATPAAIFYFKNGLEKTVNLAEEGDNEKTIQCWIQKGCPELDGALIRDLDEDE